MSIWRDSNPHVVRHRNLNPARLPISPQTVRLHVEQPFSLSYLGRELLAPINNMGYTSSHAENVGFEPTGRFYPSSSLARSHHRPLGQFSI